MFLIPIASTALSKGLHVCLFGSNQFQRINYTMSATSQPQADLSTKTLDILQRLGVPTPLQAIAFGNRWATGTGPEIKIDSPIDGQPLGEIGSATPADLEKAVTLASAAFKHW